jgi:carboxyl-terminal processing protease
MEAGRIGVLRINSLGDGEAAETRQRLSELVKQGAQKMVIDLRATAGGSINEAVTVANLFIKDGTIAETVGREGKVLKTFTADPERNRGQVVGEKSFGAGAEQQLFTLRGGDGLLLTTVKWASASGKPFLGEDRARSGVTPSVEVKRPELAEAIDPEELDGNEDDPAANPNQPTEKPETPVVEPPKVPAEDIQMKKALELLRENKVQTQRAA